MRTLSTVELMNRAYGFLVSNVVLPVGDTLYGHHMTRRLSFLRQAQWWDRQRIYDYRDRLLSETIRQAYEVPFYKELMDALKLKPDDIRSAADLHKLPVVTKDMLRAASPDRVTRNTGQKTYNSCSSGSTGAPFCVAEDNFTAGWYRASFMLSLEWAGWHIGEPHMQTGMTLNRFAGRGIKDAVLRCHYVSAYDLTDVNLARNLEIIERYNLRHLWGYPGSIYYLAKYALQTGREYSLKSVVTWGDMLYPHYRTTIEQAFGTKVTDTYGCAEGMQIAAQCEGSDDYLIHNFDVIVEVLDDGGNPVPPGHSGNLVLTRLHAGPTPLIRYKVGDIGVLSADQSPRYGRGFEVLESIQGRDTDVVVTPSGNRLIVHFFTGILEYYSQIDSFQVTQDAPDTITLRVVPRADFTDEIARSAIEHLKNHGADLTINLEVVDEIPLTSGGKRRFVINRCKSENCQG